MVDLQPASGSPDQGRLEPAVHADELLETGRDGSYREHWRRTAAAGPTAAVLLRDPDSAACAVLVRVGASVGWARGRAVPLPPGGDLRALVDAAAGLAAAQDLLDAEVSLGTAGRVVRSSLPWRVGAPLGLALDDDTASTLDTGPDGAPATRTWQVVAVEGDPADLPTLESP